MFETNLKMNLYLILDFQFELFGVLLGEHLPKMTGTHLSQVLQCAKLKIL